MTLVKYQNQFPDLLNRFFENELEGFTKRNFSNATLPSVNIKESEDGFEVEMAAPGFDKGDFKIEVNENVLTISSEVKAENEEKEGEVYTKKEFSYQSFTRSFTLPEMVDEDNISAKYENGILRISIPKKEEAKPKPVKQIEVA